MSDSATAPGQMTEPPANEARLESWGEIATYLRRDVRTVQRWEKTEDLPVRRHEHQKKSTVYAYPSELDEWVKKRQPADDPEADAAFIPEPDVDPSTENGNADSALATNGKKTITQDDGIDPDVPPEPAPPIGKRITIALIAAALLAFIAYRAFHRLAPPTAGRVYPGVGDQLKKAPAGAGALHAKDSPGSRDRWSYFQSDSISRSLWSRRKISPMTKLISATMIGYHRP